MRCPNCRCIIPNHYYRCVYCGHTVPLGDGPTEPAVYEQYYIKKNNSNRAVLRQYYAYSNRDYRRDCSLTNQIRNDYYDYTVSQRDNHQMIFGAKPNSKFDFAVVNDDGSLNLIKALTFLIAFGIASILILLLVLLLLL